MLLSFQILTRTLKGIRGHCIGTIVLFDKHWNLCLKNVQEVWKRPRKFKIPAICGPAPSEDQLRHRKIHPPKVTVLKKEKKTELCQRFVDQLLIRGEQIALIVLLDKDKAVVDENAE